MPDTTASSGKKKKRAIFVDWERAMGLYMVVMVHIMVMNQIHHWGDILPRIKEHTNTVYRVLLQFGLPLFFYFSGRATAFSKDSIFMFLWKKIKRLVLPMAVVYFLVVIPTSYISRKWQTLCFWNQMRKGEGNRVLNMSFNEFYAAFFDRGYFSCVGLGWLWFLFALFVLSLLNIPLFWWLRGQFRKDNATVQANTPRWWVLLILGAIWSAAFMAFGYLLFWDSSMITFQTELLNEFPDRNGLQFVALGYVVPSVLLVVFAYFWKYTKKYMLIMFMIVPTFSIFLSVHMPKVDADVYFITSWASALLYYNALYMEGFIDQLLDDEWETYQKRSQLYGALQPMILWGLLVAFAFTSPGPGCWGNKTPTSTGYIWHYPTYLKWESRTMYVAGTWVWLVLWTQWGKWWCNEDPKGNPWLAFQYRHMNGSAMMVYLVHWLFQDIYMTYIVNYYELGFIEGCILIYVLTLPSCWVCYFAILHVPYLGVLFGANPRSVNCDRCQRRPVEETPNEEAQLAEIDTKT